MGYPAAFVQQFVYRPGRGQDSVLLAAHPANGGQESQLAVVSLPVAHAGTLNYRSPARKSAVDVSGWWRPDCGKHKVGLIEAVRIRCRLSALLNIFKLNYRPDVGDSF